MLMGVYIYKAILGRSSLCCNRMELSTPEGPPPAKLENFSSKEELRKELRISNKNVLQTCCIALRIPSTGNLEQLRSTLTKEINLTALYCWIIQYQEAHRLNGKYYSEDKRGSETETESEDGLDINYEPERL